MRIVTVTQIDLKNGCEHVKLHTFPLPQAGDPGFYRTITSYSAFFESCRGRNRNENYLYYMNDFRDGDFRGGYEKERDSRLPVVEYKNLLDFLKGLGMIGPRKNIKMNYAVKTIDDEFWLGRGGDYITEFLEERWILDELELAQWQVDNTNIFGELKVVYVR